MSGLIELLPFQVKASQTIAERFNELCSDPKRPMEHRSWVIPFYQALSALTGAGKTPILADAVMQMRSLVETEPIILWISKAKAVVDQTYSNFQSGGKYAHLMEGFLIEYLHQLKPNIIHDGNLPCVVLATVGTFNQKDRGDGTLRVHKIDEDNADESLWTLLKERKLIPNGRRVLFIVYDEAHNLSDQQTSLLLELEPDAILLASATMKTPNALGRIIDRLKTYGWTEDKLITSIPTKMIVDAGLVKRQIILGGYETNMEIAIDDLVENFQFVTQKAKAMQVGFVPKAIYVCRTNISQDDGSLDNVARPFHERKAPPILIWRYLVEQKGIEPSEIAVYCDLKFDYKHNPPPEDFTLFSGGEEDFAVFTAGNYRHIIFNQSLQEGWDDPACCFAYIDKSMGSPIQIEQVIGRVLRQPGASHYNDADLNTAQFYIRIDSKQIFPQILETIRRKIAADIPEIKLDGYSSSRERHQMVQHAKQNLQIPEIHIDSGKAVKPLTTLITEMNDYRNDTMGNTLGEGSLDKAVQTIGDGSKPIVETQVKPHSNRVTARWLIRRQIQSLYPKVVEAIDWSNQKFDAMVEVNSLAAKKLREEAERLVEIYLEYSDLTFEEENPYSIGSILVNPSKLQNFTNSLHEGYSDLNTFELEVARCIDNTGLSWVRNPVNGGFKIPLLESGSSRNFYPDFIIWKDDLIFALDPKGDHLVQKDASSKLFDIRDEKGVSRIIVRIITLGWWTSAQHKKDTSGYSVWKLSNTGKPKPQFCQSIDEAITCALES